MKQMKVNGIEKDFLTTVREARPEDCKAIIDTLYGMPGQEEDGEYTPLGLLVGGIIHELRANGILKFEYGEEGTY